MNSSTSLVGSPCASENPKNSTNNNFTGSLLSQRASTEPGLTDLLFISQLQVCVLKLRILYQKKNVGLPCFLPFFGKFCPLHQQRPTEISKFESKFSLQIQCGFIRFIVSAWSRFVTLDVLSPSLGSRRWTGKY